MPGTLEILLRRIRDGEAGPDEIVEARALAAHDARLPEELRAGVFLDPEDAAADAAGLLAILGADDLFGEALHEAILSEGGFPWVRGDALDDALEITPEPALELPVERVEVPLPEDLEDPAWAPLGAQLAAAVRGEAGEIDVSGAIDAIVEGPRIAVAEAVRGEAGRVELAASVLARLGFATTPVAAAVHMEAGQVADLASAVLVGIGQPAPLPVAQAVEAEAGRIEVAVPVLAAVGVDVAPVAEAVRAEAGAVDVSEPVVAVIGGPASPPVAEAVRAEAGAIEVADLVSRTLSPEVIAGLLDHQLDATTHRLVAAQVDEEKRGGELTAMADLGRDLRNAVEAEGGEVDLWAAIAADIGIADPEQVAGWDPRPLVAALRDEAGAIDVVAPVMREVARYAKPVAMPLAEIPMESLPPAANRGTWALGGLLMVALVMLVLGLDALRGAPQTPGIEPVPTMTFASAHELVVEDLQYDSDVQVLQMEGDGGAVIIWVDEEAVL